MLTPNTLSVLALAETRFGGSTGPDLSRYFTVVTLILIALVGIAWGFRRLVAGSLKTRAARRSLRVIDVLPLGGKRQLSIVRCYDRTFALGLGEKDVSLVAELDPVIGAEKASEKADGAEPDTRQVEFERLLEGAKAGLVARERTTRRVEEVVG